MAIPQAQPVNAGQVPAAVPAANAAAPAPAAPVGVAAAPNTLQAAPDAGAPAQAQTGFCANVTNAITKCVETIRKWVAEHVPLFKWLAPTPTPAPVPTPNPTPAVPAPQTDAERSTLVRNPFLAGAAQPDAEILRVALDTFAGIQSPLERLVAFQAVLSSQNCDQATGKRFYDALPADQQQAFRGEIYAQNGNSDRGPDGILHGIGYGEYMANNHIRSLFALQAAQNILDAARRAAPAAP